MTDRENVNITEDDEDSNDLNEVLLTFKPFDIVSLANGMTAYLLDFMEYEKPLPQIDLDDELPQIDLDEDEDGGEAEDDLKITVTRNGDLLSNSGVYTTPDGSNVLISYMISGKGIIPVDSVRVGFLCAHNSGPELSLRIVQVPVNSISMENAFCPVNEPPPFAPFTIDIDSKGVIKSFPTGLVFICLEGEQLGAQVIGVESASSVRLLYFKEGVAYTKLAPIDAVFIQNTTLSGDLQDLLEESEEDMLPVYRRRPPLDDDDDAE
jgi:hypothetical protein